MRKLSLWLRAHPMTGDTAIAVLLLLADLSLLSSDLDSRGVTAWEFTVVGVLTCAPLAVRRRYPVLCATLALTAMLLINITQVNPAFRPAQLAVFISLYTVAAYCRRFTAAAFALATNLVLVLWVAIVDPVPDDRLRALLSLTVFYLLLTAICWGWGEFVGARRAQHSEVENRLRRLEFEQDQRARIAVAEERNRIAREIHDVLAHSVSVMINQADGASYALRAQPDLAERALRTISSTGRDALSELRGLLHVLREPDEPEHRTPQPTAASLRELVDRVRELGLRIEFELTGDFEDLPAGVGLGVYRIVQESLTNTLKHGGRNARVHADNDGRRIEVEVTDAGSPAAPPLPVMSGLPVSGTGLIGMRERAQVYGGTLDAGPCPEGGWRVHALIPLGRSTQTA